MGDDNKWKQPDAPPSPLFLGEKERNLVKQVNDEIIERVVGQQVLYFPIGKKPLIKSILTVILFHIYTMSTYSLFVKSIKEKIVNKRGTSLDETSRKGVRV